MISSDFFSLLTKSDAQPAPKTLWLEQPEQIFLVQEGALDIFLQRRDAEGQVSGARHHLYRVEAGAMVIGLDASYTPSGWGMLAVKLPDTSVSVSTLQQLQHACLVTDHTKAAQALLHAWVKSGYNAVVTEVSPGRFTRMSPQDTLTLQDAEVASPEADVVWVSITVGHLMWQGEEQIPLQAQMGIIPLHANGFVQSAGTTTKQTLDLPTVVSIGQLGSGMQQHLSCVVQCALKKLALDDKRQSQRLSDLTLDAQNKSREALEMLVGVAQSSKDSFSTSGQQDSLLLRALEQIGQYQGIDFKQAIVRDATSATLHPVAQICAASNVRYREVALKQEWWLSDCGPILAKWGDHQDWVALLPVDDSSYVMVHPATGTSSPVTLQIANQLAPYGYTFYRALPHRTLAGMDLLSFGFFGRWRDLQRVLTISLLTGLLGIMIPVFSGLLIDTLIPQADVLSIWMLLSAMMVVTVATSMLNVVQSIALLRFESGADNALQSAVMDRVLKLPMPFFRDYTNGDLAMRINSINAIRRAMSGSTIHTLLGGIFSFFNFLLLFAYSPKLAGVATMLVMVAIVMALTLGYLKLRYERHLASASGKLSSLVFQYLNNITKIRITAAESRAFANWARRYAQVRGLAFKSQHLSNIEHTFFTGYEQLMTAAIFAGFGFLLSKEESIGMSAGHYIAFSAAFGAFFAGLTGLVSTGLNLLRLVPVYERAKPLLQTEPEPSNNLPNPGTLQGEIEVTNVSFAYPQSPAILEDVSFTIRTGEFVALVGPSGSGKSTLLRLLLGFEKPTSGTISYDGQNMNAIDIGALRRQLGVVLQSGKLMTGDIFSNIVGSSNLTKDDAWEAARMVGLDEDIEQMPMGMHTVISEGASTFSGGQRQRMMIARAIVHRPRILYFDEATSALDNRTQAIVTQSLDRMKSTRIVIAHRLSTIVNANRILVLQAGRIVQDGTYADLLEQPGLFQDLAKRKIA